MKVITDKKDLPRGFVKISEMNLGKKRNLIAKAVEDGLIPGYHLIQEGKSKGLLFVRKGATMDLLEDVENNGGRLKRKSKGEMEKIRATQALNRVAEQIDSPRKKTAVPAGIEDKLDKIIQLLERISKRPVQEVMNYGQNGA